MAGAVGPTLVCLDKFRGSIAAAEACAAVRDGLLAATPERPVRCHPVADGGEGTVAALLAAGHHAVTATVRGPLGAPVTATLAVAGRSAVVELAQAAGLALAPPGAALVASTWGVGELVAIALERGCREITLAVGGSATTDGGAGMLQALGARLLDRRGRPVGPGGAALRDVDAVDLGGLHPGLRRAELILASDVDNPLLGRNGAAAVYGPQKGAGPAEVEALEAGLARFAPILERAAGRSVAGMAGAGAAGGTGFAALALGARRRPGIDVVLDAIGLRAVLPGAGLVIVGEGRLDEQSLQGKAPIGVAHLAKAAAVPVIAVAGEVLVDREQLQHHGIVAAYALTDLTTDRASAMRDAKRLLTATGKLIGGRAS